LQHRELVFADDAALFEAFEKLPDLVARLDVGGSALNEPLKPTGYSGIGTRVSIVRHRDYVIE
jgi:hypothetical protein